MVSSPMLRRSARFAPHRNVCLRSGIAMTGRWSTEIENATSCGFQTMSAPGWTSRSKEAGGGVPQGTDPGATDRPRARFHLGRLHAARHAALIGNDYGDWLCLRVTAGMAPCRSWCTGRIAEATGSLTDGAWRKDCSTTRRSRAYPLAAIIYRCESDAPARVPPGRVGQCAGWRQQGRERAVFWPHDGDPAPNRAARPPCSTLGRRAC